MRESTWKGLVTGIAAGMVAYWSVMRFYRMARASSSRHALIPYCAGAGIGALYGHFALRRDAPKAARVPLGAAIYLAEPERTAAPPKGGRDMQEKAGNLALRIASRGLKKAAEKALFA